MHARVDPSASAWADDVPQNEALFFGGTVIERPPKARDPEFNYAPPVDPSWRWLSKAARWLLTLTIEGLAAYSNSFCAGLHHLVRTDDDAAHLAAEPAETHDDVSTLEREARESGPEPTSPHAVLGADSREAPAAAMAAICKILRRRASNHSVRFFEY
jgi:hypothetical protein